MAITWLGDKELERDLVIGLPACLRELLEPSVAESVKMRPCGGYRGKCVGESVRPDARELFAGLVRGIQWGEWSWQGG